MGDNPERENIGKEEEWKREKKKEKKNVLNYLILPVGAESILNRFKLDEIWSRLEARFFFIHVFMNLCSIIFPIQSSLRNL